MRKTILALLTGAALYTGACHQEVEEPVAQPTCPLTKKVHDSNGNHTMTVLDHDQDCKPEWVVTHNYDVTGTIQRSETNGYRDGKNDFKMISNYIGGTLDEKFTFFGTEIKYENEFGEN